ncbi:MAG: hypothetical protein AAGK14_04180 [Verrucomicrobiota bacterium]
MNSVFEKARQANAVELFTYEGIQNEVKNSARTKVKPNPLYTLVRVTGVVLFGTLLALFFLDPFIYPIQKTKAMRSIVYLNLYGDPADVQRLAASSLLDDQDVEALMVKDGDYRAFFPGGTAEAREVGASALAYMEEVKAMHEGNVDALTIYNRIRYYLFVPTGLRPPKYWTSLNPDASDIQPPVRGLKNILKLEKRSGQMEYTGVGAKKK